MEMVHGKKAIERNKSMVQKSNFKSIVSDKYGYNNLVNNSTRNID